jgi:hypothetical protein
MDVDCIEKATGWVYCLSNPQAISCNETGPSRLYVPRMYFVAYRALTPGCRSRAPCHVSRSGSFSPHFACGAHTHVEPVACSRVCKPLATDIVSCDKRENLVCIRAMQHGTPSTGTVRQRIHHPNISCRERRQSKSQN